MSTLLKELRAKWKAQGCLEPDDAKRYRALLAELLSSDFELAINLLVPFNLTMPVCFN